MASTMARAFDADPVFTWLIGPRHDRGARLQRIFEVFLRVELAKPDHLVEVTGNSDGVAIWHDVDDWRTPTAHVVRNAPAIVRAFGRRSLVALRTLTMIERAHPAEPHRHLAFVAVDPSRQGGGLGGSLLSAALDRCDEEGLPAYLESSNPRNEALYVRHGFVAQGSIGLPAGAPPLTAMWRAPR